MDADRDPAQTPEFETPWPVCPRHPDRAARLACRSCARPTCPECQVPDSAGFRCLDCVDAEAVDHGPSRPGNIDPAPMPERPEDPWGHRASNPPLDHDLALQGWPAHRFADQDVPDPQASVHTADVGAHPTQSAARPYVTHTITALCVLVYLLQWLIPSLTTAGDFSPLMGWFEPWRFITSAFLHSTDTLMHLPFNLMALYSMGQFLEPAMGRARYLALYLLSALGGAVFTLLMAPHLDLADPASAAWAQPMVGASGAVFGLFAAAFVVLRRTGAPVAGMVALIAINLALPFFTPNVAWQAHVGGAITGLVVALLYFATARIPGRGAHIGVVVGCAVVLIAAAWFKYAANADALAALAGIRTGV